MGLSSTAGRAALTVPVMLLALAGCGGGGSGSDGRGLPTATGSHTTTTQAQTATTATQSTPAPSGTATSGGGGATVPAATTPHDTATTGSEAKQGGGGDEQGARIPVHLRIGRDGTLTPAVVRIPAFFRIAVTLDSAGGTRHAFTVRSRFSVTTTTSRGGVTLILAAHRPATYVLQVDGRTEGRIVTGAAVGP